MLLICVNALFLLHDEFEKLKLDDVQQKLTFYLCYVFKVTLILQLQFLHACLVSNLYAALADYLIYFHAFHLYDLFYQPFYLHDFTQDTYFPFKSAQSQHHTLLRPNQLLKLRVILNLLLHIVHLHLALDLSSHDVSQTSQTLHDHHDAWLHLEYEHGKQLKGQIQVLRLQQ